MYRIDENTIWEDTGRISIHAGSDFLYFRKLYKEIKRGGYGWKLVEGPVISAVSLSAAQEALLRIAAEAQRGLSAIQELELKDKLIKR